MGRENKEDAKHGLTLRKDIQKKRNLIAARLKLLERKRELEEINKPFYE